ncbi:hypothetical protein ACOME3_004403 [Neoechinorhynchus agilis]
MDAVNDFAKTELPTPRFQPTTSLGFTLKAAICKLSDSSPRSKRPEDGDTKMQNKEKRTIIYQRIIEMVLDIQPKRGPVTIRPSHGCSSTVAGFRSYNSESAILSAPVFETLVSRRVVQLGAV